MGFTGEIDFCFLVPLKASSKQLLAITGTLGPGIVRKVTHLGYGQDIQCLLLTT